MLKFRAFKADRAVVDAVLEVCQPIGIEASLEALKGSQPKRTGSDGLWSWQWKERDMSRSGFGGNTTRSIPPIA
jgi:hypothetical protein